ncbi:MAG TPA: hypothetical protein VII16_03080 [Actinomycetes bacterium]
MVVRFTRSSRKHRIGTAHALAVMATARPIRLPAAGALGDDQLVWIGPDDRGLELEIIALELADCLLVIHVMPTALRGEGGDDDDQEDNNDQG